MKKSGKNTTPALMLMLAVWLALTGCSADTKSKTAAESSASPVANAPTAAPALQGTSKAGARGLNEKNLRVGVDANFPPMVFHNAKGELVGFDIELSQEAFKRMGAKAEYIDLHWDTKDRELITNKQVDMLWSGVNISEERAKVYEFSVPYLSNKQVAVVLASSPIRTIADLNGKAVGVQRGSSLIPRLESARASGTGVGKIETYEEYAGILVSMLQGKLEGGFMGSVALESYMKNTPGKFRILEENLGETNMAVAFRKEDQAFVEKFNKTLDAMKADGTVDKLRARWFDSKTQ